MRQGHDVTNATLRRLGLERHEATAALLDLVDRGLVFSTGGRKFAKYALRQNLAETRESLFGDLFDDEPGTTPSRGKTGRPSRRDEVLELFDDGRTLTAHEVGDATGLGIAMVRRYLSQLVETGLLAATAQTTDRKRAYRRPGR